MTSSLVSRLLSDIQVCFDAEERCSLIAELACYWARIGEFENAERLRVEIRREFGTGKSLKVSVLVMCLESILLYYRELSPSARERMVGAHALSKAAKNHPLTALTASWLAHIDFNLGRFDSMASSLEDCSRSILSDDGNAMCRVSLVLGDAFLYAGDLVASRRWYESARMAAMRIGDHAAIGAMTYNRAALRVFTARLAKLKSSREESDLRIIDMEVDSAINYQSMAELKSLDHLLMIAKAGALILQNRYPESEPIVRNLLASSSCPVGSSQQLLLSSDLAQILASTGRTEEATQRVLALQNLETHKLGHDDKALYFSSVANASELCGHLDWASRARDQSDCALQEHFDNLRDLKRVIARYTEGAL